MPGRHTGRVVSFLLVAADYRGERHLVTMLGQSMNWVLNACAAGASGAASRAAHRFTRNALPAIRPVNHLVADGQIVIRSSLGTILSAEIAASEVRPWVTGEMEQVIRIRPEIVTGFELLPR